MAEIKEETTEEKLEEEELEEPLKVEEPDPIVIPPPEKVKTSNLEDDIGILGKGFTKIGETILSAASTTIDVDNIPARKFLLVMIHIIGSSANTGVSLRFNNDSGANEYTTSFYIQAGNGIDSADLMYLHDQSVSGERFGYLNIMNESSFLKMSNGIFNDGGSIGMKIFASKWNNTTDQISRITIIADGAVTFNTNSKVTVFGNN